MAYSGSGDRNCLCHSKRDGSFMICCDRCNCWFHGDCVHITEQQAVKILHFYCPPCINADSRLSIVYESNVQTRCGQCIGCFRTDDCGKCDECQNMKPCKQRRCVNAELLVEESKKAGKTFGMDKVKPQKRSKPKEKETRQKWKNRRKQEQQQERLITKTRSTRSSIRAYQRFIKESGFVSEDEKDKLQSRQCFGLQCTKEARKDSKYCSEDCGLILARARLCTFLPSRVSDYWEQPPLADVRQRDQLNAVREKQKNARERLAQLDLETSKLTTWLENGYCTVCGLEFALRILPKHVAKCFAKLESQSSYGSAFKAVHNPYSLFCDTFNKVNGTYCKRLRVLCPEHGKSAQNDGDMCGRPVNWSQNAVPDSICLKNPTQALDLLCTLTRNKCRRHYQWDKVAQALIDSERLSLLLKLDELFEEERALRISLVARGSVVALLTHQTIAH